MSTCLPRALLQIQVYGISVKKKQEISRKSNDSPESYQTGIDVRRQDEEKTYLTFGICRTLDVMSMASGMYFSTVSKTPQNSLLSRSMPFLARR